ncbi:mitochondrial matrix Mmp37-domain-containing protein [Calycina marina]|uniref:Phosphatidate cytidylyltransferase, mitochondrial n=1 Tax=Calycina marina TaxID=1763456 RepID=A0A9P8CJL2_9HELO|nr:mitochondrial matrix Mmp37-domain-containing protein [Calycina marina]
MAAMRLSLGRSLRLTAPRTSLRTSPAQYCYIQLQATVTGRRALATQPTKGETNSQGQQVGEHVADSGANKNSNASSLSNDSSPASSSKSSTTLNSPPADWEDADINISKFAELPEPRFGYNQHMNIDAEFKEVLRLVPWEFDAVPYVFAYGSGVFQQSATMKAKPSSATSIHSNPPPALVKAQGGMPKMIDFIFGVTHTQHFHSLNLKKHRDHYSGVGSLGSGAVSAIQDNWGAGVYYNTHINCRGMLIKYGVVNINTLCKDLSEWQTLYIAGRLQKPVKILRDHPKVRLANQVNLISALRTALLLLPPQFTEQELYGTIASISYLGDPRMSLPAEDPSKVANIVGNNLPNFRKLYSPLIESLPNVRFSASQSTDPDWLFDAKANHQLEQDMDPMKRGNMVRRLPKAFRSKLYFQYQSKYEIPGVEFNKMMEDSSDESGGTIKRREGGGFERRIASEPPEELRTVVRGVIKKTISWPSTTQSLKGIVTAGLSKSWRYASEKLAKSKAGKHKVAEDEKANSTEKESEKEKEKSS